VKKLELVEVVAASARLNSLQVESGCASIVFCLYLQLEQLLISQGIRVFGNHEEVNGSIEISCLSPNRVSFTVIAFEFPVNYALMHLSVS